MHLEIGGVMVGVRNQAVGAYGERVAERYLGGLGMAVLERNWRCADGELDLVLRDGDVLVACEVKTRSSDAYGSPHEAIAADKLDRLQRLASRWAAERLSVTPPAIRIDLVAVRTGERGAAHVDHVRGLL
ncbi:MAG TPA: YraN family protein [Nocardioides sp.]|nr:YraN family protein [Nocardioides sp.]